MAFVKRLMFRKIIVLIIVIEIGRRVGNLTMVIQSKILSDVTSTSEKTHNVTVVTAFFDIGTVKRVRNNVRNPSEYFKWAEAYRYMRNALVVYTDSEPFRNHITAIRSDLSQLTKIFMINMSSLWSFQNLKKVTEIYNLKSFPKRYPNTSPLYTCVTHAKFDLIIKTAQDNIFKTKYFMWLDLGYFRYRESHNIFHLSKPKYFNDSKIAVNVVNDTDNSISPSTIVRTCRRYIGGGLFYGEKTCVILLAEDFKRAVRYFLSRNIINAEEQILYAMFSKRGKQILEPNVELQLYRRAKEKTSKWYYLGHSMITEEKLCSVFQVERTDEKIYSATSVEQHPLGDTNIDCYVEAVVLESFGRKKFECVQLFDLSYPVVVQEDVTIMNKCRRSATSVLSCEMDFTPTVLHDVYSSVKQPCTRCKLR